MTSKLIDLYLINGFLGSGKTTFLSELSNHLSSKSKRCGLIINEFGEINFDSIILSDHKFILTEISNGSIFCSCLHGNFIEALIQFATNTNIDVLLIEASGLADPSSIDKDLAIVEKKIKKIYRYKGAICIIDAKNFLNLTEVIQTVNRQIKFSNIAIINKIDLVINPTILAIENKVMDLNPQIQILKSSYGKIILNESLLEGERSITKDPSLYDSLNTPSTRNLTLSLKTNRMLSTDKIILFIQSFIRSTYRIKGLFLSNDGWYHLNCVSDSLEFKKTSITPEQTQISVIFKIGFNKEEVSQLKRKWRELTQDTQDGQEQSLLS